MNRLVVIVMLLLAGGSVRIVNAKGPYDWAFVRLDYARQEKVQQLQHFCQRTHDIAQQIREDETVKNFFDLNYQYLAAERQGAVPDQLNSQVKILRTGFDHYYIENYFIFYDMLFVDMDGEVFYSLRKQVDLYNNLLQADNPDSALARQLRLCPEKESFVDFHHYGPSQEAAAFFIEPIFHDQQQAGWVILQCAINKVNSIFAWTETLGQTGETFLVNTEGLMLTESNFLGDSTILRKRLDDRNIQRKFEEGNGHRTVTDYRGRTAVTSFEVIEYLGTRWLVVAKIDKDEVTTDYYQRHQRYYEDRLLQRLKEISLPPPVLKPTTNVAMTRVDMDEFQKADPDTWLETFGIATCTGLLASYPPKFAYLAHISPRDKIYNYQGTNLLGQMVKRIESFDIYPYQKHHLVFVIVAPHLETTTAIIDKLLKEGYLLSQIRVFFHPQAESAEMRYFYPDSHLEVTWRIPQTPPQDKVYSMSQAVNVGDVIEWVMQSEQEATIPKVE